MSDHAKYTVYLPADFVRQLQQRATAEGRSPHGVIALFLRTWVNRGIADWRKREAAGAPASLLAPRLAAIEVPAHEAAFYEQLVRYLEAAGAPSEQEWKHGLRRAVGAWGAARR